jgi:FKBP-type peptidyl-prolyl cis-trans isomerase FkpA
VNSNIAITYVGKFLSGEVFDQRSTPNNTPQNPHWPLSGLIEGWIIGIPLIKEGGSIRLLVPSALAYGCEGRSVIPGNTPLFFEVTLVDVQ